MAICGISCEGLETVAYDDGVRATCVGYVPCWVSDSEIFPPTRRRNHDRSFSSFPSIMVRKYFKYHLILLRHINVKYISLLYISVA